MPTVAVSPASPPAPFSSSSNTPSQYLFSSSTSSTYTCSCLHTASHNGLAKPSEDMSVAEIKNRAIQQVQRSRGASAISLIRSAKGQFSLAQTREGAGDLKSAFGAFTKAACLIQIFMDSAEFKAESVPGKQGVLWREFTDFRQVCGTLFMHSSISLMLFRMRAVTLRSAHML